MNIRCENCDGAHHIVIGEVAIGDGDERGRFDGTDQIGGAMREEQVIQPHISSSEDANGAPVRAQAMAIMLRRVAYHSRSSGHEIEHAHAVMIT